MDVQQAMEQPLEGNPDEGIMAHDDILALLDTITLHKGPYSPDLPGVIGLTIPPGSLTTMAAELEIPMARILGQSFPWFQLKPTPALLEVLAARGIYSTEAPAVIQRHYGLELMSHGRLFVRYQQIIGSWKIGGLSPDELTAFFSRLKKLIKESYL